MRTTYCTQFKNWTSNCCQFTE